METSLGGFKGLSSLAHWSIQVKVGHVAPYLSSDSSAAWRILDSQVESGLDSRAVVCRKRICLPATLITAWKVNTSLTLKFNRVVASIKTKLLLSGSNRSPWTSVVGGVLGFSRTIRREKFEVVNIHWVPGLINIRKMKKILDVPIVITLHDVWMLTGGCHCNYECNNWSVGCSLCPQKTPRMPRIYSPESDFEYKLKHLKRIRNLSFVGPSKWICEMASISPIVAGRKIVHIPNPLDPNIFKPLTKSKLTRDCAESEVRRLLFVVSGSIQQYHKGFDFLIEIIGYVREKIPDHIELVIVGDTEGANLSKIGIPIVELGVIVDQCKMSETYRSCDLLLHTSRQDNYPGTILEALSCGTRTIGFDVGGVSELINNESFGTVIPKFNVSEYANQIIRHLNQKHDFHDRLAMHKQIMVRHEPNVVADQYQKLYESCLSLPKN